MLSLYLKVLHDMVSQSSEINSESSHYALEIYVLNIEENYLTRQLSWKFTFKKRFC